MARHTHKKRKGGRFSTDDVPNPVACAAFEGFLDAVETAATEAGLSKTAALAMRSVGGMLIGVGIAESGKPLEFEVDGAGPILIRAVDAKAAATRGLAELTRLEVAHAMKAKTVRKLRAVK